MFKISSKRKSRPANDYNFHDVGFHGDHHLISLVNYLCKNVTRFIETGTNVGSTTTYIGKTHGTIDCVSCEPDQEAFQRAKRNTANLANVELYNLDSIKFFNRIESDKPNFFNEKTLFWLDAHGYGFQWPIREEVTFISENFKDAYILIDDFKVPHLEVFGYDAYDKQECSYEFIRKSFQIDDYQLYYPNYIERTSKHHPLRGWGLFILGDTLPSPDTDVHKILLS